MKHLVTGSRGFLGSALLPALGPDAVGLDLPECDVMWDADGNNPDSPLDFYVGTKKPETVWHLAALNGSTQGFYDRPWDVLNVQVRGTLNVIDACVANGVKTLVLFSSSEVFQAPPKIPTPEDVPLTVPDLTNPRYSYGGGKIAAELMAWWSPIPRVVICRPHNVYGVGQKPGHVIADFIDRALSTPDGGTFDIHGSTTRSFIYIDDFVAGVLAAAKHVESLPGDRIREVYNVGTEEQVSTVALAGMVSKACGRERDGRYAYRFKTHDGPAGGTRSRCPDTRKLRATGWEAKVKLEEGLRRVVAYREGRK